LDEPRPLPPIPYETAQTRKRRKRYCDEAAAPVPKEVVTQRSQRPDMEQLASEARFRIVSANLWNGAADPDAFAELVAGLHADAVALQEMTPEQADAVARVMPYGQLDPARDFNGMGIALREPATVRRIGLPLRDARVAHVQWERPAGTRLELEILNVHMQAPHSPPTWTAMRTRRGQMRGVIRHLRASPHRRRVVVGDLNATPLWPVYRRLAAGLTDAAIAAARRHGRSVQPTWGPWPGAPRLLRIDHALVHGVAVTDFQVVPITGGDHSAIVVDIAVPMVALAAPSDNGAAAPAVADEDGAAWAPATPVR
jgi:endonuclease/exonuclease/phosphatase family metal-dependent hydrolase